MLDVGLLLLEQISGLLIFRRVAAVDAVAQPQLRNGKGVPAVVEHEDFARVLGVPQGRPAGDVVHIFAVVDQAHGAPGVGHGIEIVRVIGRVAERFIHVLIVGDVVEVQGLQHILGNEPSHHVVRRDDDIVGGTAGFQLGVHGLVAVEGHIFDLDAGFLFKGGNHIEGTVGTVGNILAPVVDVNGAAGGRRGGQRQGDRRQQGAERQGNNAFHQREGSLLWVSLVRRRFRSRSCSRFMATISRRITPNINANRA